LPGGKQRERKEEEGVQGYSITPTKFILGNRGKRKAGEEPKRAILHASQLVQGVDRHEREKIRGKGGEEKKLKKPEPSYSGSKEPSSTRHNPPGERC